MAQDSITTTVICSSLEQDYGYDKDNSVFLFYPSRPAFESSRHSLFPPVRLLQGVFPSGTNHSVSIPQVSTTFRYSETIEYICRYLSAHLRYVSVDEAQKHYLVSLVRVLGLHGN